jgi:uncharacterized protein (UPF0276 family)
MSAQPQSLSAAANPKSFGCELHPLLFDKITVMKTAGLIDHIQVTVPNTVGFKDAFRFSEQIPTIVHSNLLNTFGENNWSELKPVSKQVQALKPIHVVEHFTAFRQNSEKSGIYFNLSLFEKRNFEKIVDVVRRWQDLLDAPLCLENVAIVENVEAYFNLLCEVREKTGCKVVCDLPHFFISAFSASFSDEQIVKTAKALNPIQVHAGGLTCAYGILKDNHKGYSPWIAGAGHLLFTNAEYMTLEQSPQIPATTIEKYLTDCKAPSVSTVPRDIKMAKGASATEVNDDLAIDAIVSIGLSNGVRRSPDTTTEIDSAVDLYSKYQPFVFPLASLEDSMGDLTPAQAVQVAASISKLSMLYQSWWNPEAGSYSRVSYGEENTLIHTSILSEDGSYNSANLGEENIKRFQSVKNNFWCDVAMPKISIKNRDKGVLIND